MENIIKVFLDNVAELGNEPAISDTNGTFTYQELYDYSIAVAANLKKNGVGHGGRVIVEIQRCKEYAACLIGCWLIGAVTVPLSDDYPEDRLAYIKKDSRYELSIDEAFVSSMDFSLRTEPVIPEFEDEGVVIYTSGSTGNPKGVVHDFAGMSAVAFRNVLHDKSEKTERNNIAGLIAPFTFVVGMSHLLAALALAKHLVIVPDEIRRDPFKLAAYYDENNIESSYVPPRLVDFMLKHNKSLKVISVGSERITNLYFNDKPVVVNGYGCTEIFGGTLAFKIDQKYENTPIGKPIGDEKAYVLDENGNESDFGELCIAGHVAKGYLNREKETKRSFIRNPFRDRDGFDRMFKTGDLVQRLPDGNLVFIERKDWMIKINGQRVEPLEVEKTIRRLTGIEAVAVRDFTAPNGITYLAAYYVCGDDLTEEMIRRHCKTNLTSYMVPSFYIRMDALPLNPNGKLDRNGLPEPDISAFKREYVAPESRTEAAVCGAMEAVLSCGRVGRNDDFFLLGGDSVKVIEAINMLDGLPLDTETFFAGRTPAGIVRLIENGGAERPVFERVEKDAYPLTSSQLGIYFAVAGDPETLMYNNPVAVRLPAETDSGRLTAAVEKAVNNHLAYHCSIDLRDGTPCMIPNDRVFTVDRLTVSDPEAALKDFVRPFDLQGGVLIRACLYEGGEGKILAMDAHHIVFDGTTLSVLLKEITRAYDGNELYEEKTSAFDLSVWEESLKASDRYAEACAYYDSRFEGIEPENDFPADYPDTGAAVQRTVEVSITPDREKLLKFLRENSVTENSLLLAVYAYVLAKFNGTDRSLVCVGESGRHTSVTWNTAGMLVKTIPLPVDLSAAGDVSTFVTGLQETFRASVANDLCSFGDLAAKYGITNDFGFVWQNDSFSALELHGERYPVTGLTVPDAMSKLYLMAFRRGDSYRLSFRYRSDLYDEAVIRSFADAYACAVNEFICRESLRDVELLSAERVKQLDSFCSDRLEMTEKTVPELFREWAARTPDRDFTVSVDRHVTYGEADRITDRIAGYILSLGLKRNDVVSILIPRDEWIMLAPLGVLKAGCAYEPMDAAYPTERLSFMIRNADARLLITTRELENRIAGYTGPVLYTDEIADLPETLPLRNLNEPDDLFVLLYTSGTTGNPKGVMLTHQNASVIAQQNQYRFAYSGESVCACYASFGFDACFFDMATVPACGGCVHVIPEEIRLDLPVLDRYFIENRITHVVMTTQVGRQYALMTRSPYLKVLIVGGEALVPLKADELTFDFYNLYGPTECTCYITYEKAGNNALRVPIGRVNPNGIAYVVDTNMNRLPVGAPGELLYAGPQTGKGYLNLPEKTDAVFIDNPFSDVPGYRKAYRTGDIVRFLPDGRIDFIGRHDGQVKVRGFRIELTEVEEIIRRFDGITDATVAAFDDTAGGKYLAAYVVSDATVDTDALREFILSEKPAYMVPAVIMQLDAIPLTQNQKVNRRALPVPERKAEDQAAPENDTQRKIHEVVSGVLGNTAFGIDTDLYYAGLTSVSVIRLSVELENAFGIPFRVADIRTNSTVRQLEELIASAVTAESREILPDYPITRTQMGIYIECVSDPGSVTYNIPVLLRLSERLDTGKLLSAVRTAFDAHPYVKTTLFADTEGNIRARRNDAAELSIDHIVRDKLPAADEMVRPFKLLDSPLCRIALYET
ncbi:MAG: amino acid adenylation domain-containing protein, partial [Clostridia bacterium]|nr:amino acid adenylation domain-containing protein [Clostridia bacterium]